MVSTTLLLTLVIGAAQAAPQLGGPRASFAPRLSSAPQASIAPRLSAAAPAPRLSQAPGIPAGQAPAPLASAAPRFSLAGGGVPAASPQPRLSVGVAPAPFASPAPRASQALQPGFGSAPRATNFPVQQGTAPRRGLFRTHIGRFISAPWANRRRKMQENDESGLVTKRQASGGVAFSAAPRATLGVGVGPAPAPRASQAFPNAPRVSNALPNAPRASNTLPGPPPPLSPPPPLGGTNGIVSTGNDQGSRSSRNTINKAAEAGIQMLPVPWSNAKLDLSAKPEKKLTTSRTSKKQNTTSPFQKDVEKSKLGIGRFFQFPKSVAPSENIETGRTKETSTFMSSLKKLAIGPVYDHLNLRTGRQNSTESIDNESTESRQDSVIGSVRDPR